MDELKTRPVSPTELARQAMRQLVTNKLPPTPENFANAYRELTGEIGTSFATAKPTQDEDAEAGAAWAGLIGALVRGLERTHRGLPSVRKRDAVLHVVSATTRPKLLQERLSRVVQSWDHAPQATEADTAGADLTVDELPNATTPNVAAQEVLGSGGSASSAVASSVSAPSVLAPSTATSSAATSSAATSSATSNTLVPGADMPHAPLSNAAIGAVMTSSAPTPKPDASAHHQRGTQPLKMAAALAEGLRATLPEREPSTVDIATALERLALELHAGAPSVDELATLDHARKLARKVEHIAHKRERLLNEMRALLGEACGTMTTMSSDCGWMRGRIDELRSELEGSLDTRLLSVARETLREATTRQAELTRDRERVHEAIKSLLAEFVDRLGDIGLRTHRHHDNIVDYARKIESASSLDDLSQTLGGLLKETRGMRDEMRSTHRDMSQAQTQVAELQSRVRSLESELADASEAMQTDPLTQVLNRRGAESAFVEAAKRCEANRASFAVALLDLDDFKKLNDTYGHVAGDDILMQFTNLVGTNARPTDTLARYGGEEFVLLMPAAELEDAANAVRRAQRMVTHQCFLHDDRRLFVTFSAGVTIVRPNESLRAALERADEALYDAKTSGKNRVCTA